MTASERATDMISATTRASSGDRESSGRQASPRPGCSASLPRRARRGLDPRRPLMVADADLAGRDVPGLLRKSGVEAFVQDAQQFITTNDRTWSSITSAVMLALGWLSPTRRPLRRQSRGVGFDVAELLRPARRVFLLGAEEAQTRTAGLRLTGHYRS
ncbi:hypothetical protein HBB16_06445 [Pseudonocardia sp. MCCB 268]|nr:hypothetical protein [Pseudonocardia cytotoxica]